MNVTAKRFADENGVNAWVNNDVHSAGIEVNTEALDLTTGFLNEEKAIMFVKASTPEKVNATVDATIKAINGGQLITYRAFSKTPFYEGQDMDINPQTNESLDRYSQVRLCPVAKRDELHRVFITPKVVAEQAPVANEA